MRKRLLTVQKETGSGWAVGTAAGCWEREASKFSMYILSQLLNGLNATHLVGFLKIL